MCEINWSLLLEYLKVFLGWPPIALTIALYFFCRFSSEIKSFLNRVVEGNLMGQTFRAAHPMEQRDLTGADADRLSQVMEVERSQRLNATTTNHLAVPAELQNDPQALEAMAWVHANPGQTLVEYRRLLFSYNCERLFIAIYGTQISLLEHLASRQAESLPLAELASFHEAHQKIVGNTEYQLRDYIMFLVNFGVITIEGPTDNQRYRISEYGLNFMSYIKAQYPVAWSQRAF